MNEFWQHCSALLERELTPQQYVTWIKPLAPVAFDADANTLSIAAPNRFKLDWVKSQFSGRIADMARDFWHAPIDVQFVLDPKAGMRGDYRHERRTGEARQWKREGEQRSDGRDQNDVVSDARREQG
ncbi:DnaA N-terminal domain-containing protein, partial [Paraburkholderia sp. Ac-20342]|uniref:DnaA N-terminal domain-containing protein n=1 Tax=Paraburkholderia sp. Ac-20342 TaxID=2703889 RepID=UPI002402D23C